MRKITMVLDYILSAITGVIIPIGFKFSKLFGVVLLILAIIFHIYRWFILKDLNQEESVWAI